MLTGAPAQPSIKKKKIIKLSTNQKKRKLKLKLKGEAHSDRASRKGERDALKLDRKLVAKAMW